MLGGIAGISRLRICSELRLRVSHADSRTQGHRRWSRRAGNSPGILEIRTCGCLRLAAEVCYNI